MSHEPECPGRERLVVVTVLLGAALFVAATNAGAASSPTVRQVAAIIARHNPALANDQAAEDSRLPSRMPDCGLLQARVDRATADAKDSQSLGTDLAKAVGKDAQQAPKKIRSRTKQTIKQARTVVNQANSGWSATTHIGAPRSQYCDRALGYLDTFFQWPWLLDRWRPYLT